MKFASKFLGLPFQFELSFAVRENSEEVLDGPYSEFLAYQTHNNQNLALVKMLLKQEQ